MISKRDDGFQPLAERRQRLGRCDSTMLTDMHSHTRRSGRGAVDWLRCACVIYRVLSVAGTGGNTTGLRVRPAAAGAPTGGTVSASLTPNTYINTLYHA